MAEGEAPRIDSEAAAPAGVERDLGLSIRAALLAWAIPGAGHVFLGRRRLGVMFCAIVLASLAIGVSLDGNLSGLGSPGPIAVLRGLATLGVGLSYFLLRFFAAYAGDVVASGFEYGSAFILTAGLMNILLVLDAWDISVGRKA